MTQVAICTPHGGGVRPEYYRRVLTMQGHALQHTFVHMEVDLQIVGKARNVLVESCLTQLKDVEVMFFIDNDVMVPPDASVLIDQALQYGTMSGLYFNRHSPFTPQMYKLSTIPGEEGMYEPIIDYPEHGIMMVDATGFGCMCVRRDVLENMRESAKNRFEAIEQALKYNLRNNNGAMEDLDYLLRYSRNLSPWFEFLDKKGEDFYFCEHARDAGYNIFVNIDVKCEHVGDVPISEGHFKWIKDNNLYVRVGLDGHAPTEAEVAG